MEGEWWSVGLQPACSRTRIRAFQPCMQRHDTLEGLARGMIMMASRKHVSFLGVWIARHSTVATLIQAASRLASAIFLGHSCTGCEIVLPARVLPAA